VSDNGSETYRHKSSNAARVRQTEKLSTRRIQTYRSMIFVRFPHSFDIVAATPTFTNLPWQLICGDSRSFISKELVLRIYTSYRTVYRGNNQNKHVVSDNGSKTYRHKSSNAARVRQTEKLSTRRIQTYRSMIFVRFPHSFDIFAATPIFTNLPSHNLPVSAFHHVQAANISPTAWSRHGEHELKVRFGKVILVGRVIRAEFFHLQF
jgi:hypothetical protein